MATTMLGYRFSCREAELHIEHERISPVVVTIEPFAMVIRGPRSIGSAADGIDEELPARFALDDMLGAVQCIRERIAARGWRAPALPRVLLLGHLLAERARGLAGVNPPAHAVESAVFRVAQRLPRLAAEPAFYDAPWVVKDVPQYRAAACALAYLEDRLYPPWARRRRLAGRGRPSTEALIDAMREWRSLFSPSGEAYRSLNRTLMNLPAAVPADLLCGLAGYRLSGPVTERLPLSMLLLHLSDERAGRNEASAAVQRRILETSRPEEVAAAVERIAAHTGRRLRPERIDHLECVVRYLSDDPDPLPAAAALRGRLDAWVHRALRWHEQFTGPARPRPAAPRPDRAPRPAAATPQADPTPPRRRSQRPTWPAERRTARPPIPLPSIPGVEFLATAGRIVAEGRRMKNCIASYVDSAVAGRCYLFHVTHAGQEASVEVDPAGRVRQAEGPANTENVASIWGERRLAKWARGLPPLIASLAGRWAGPPQDGVRPCGPAAAAWLRAAAARPDGRRRSPRRARDPRQLELWPQRDEAS